MSITAKEGSATVSVAPVGVPPTGLSVWNPTRIYFQRRSDVFGETPKTAGETPALPSFQ